jgi:hypothetical protein
MNMTMNLTKPIYTLSLLELFLFQIFPGIFKAKPIFISAAATRCLFASTQPKLTLKPARRPFICRTILEKGFDVQRP